MLKFVKFAELPVADQDRAVNFYTEKVGLEVVQGSPYMDGWRCHHFGMTQATNKAMVPALDRAVFKRG